MALRYRRVYGMLLLSFGICLVFLAVVVYPAFSSRGLDVWGPRIRELAPDFILEDLDGEKVRLVDQRGKVVLLVFSTTWCPHCREMPPYLNELHREYAGRGLVIFNIDIQEHPKKVRSYAASQGIKYRILLDAKAETATFYEVRGVPSLILIDKDGTIICRQCTSVGAMLGKLLPA